MSNKIIDLEFQGDPPNIYCPVCGTVIHAEGKEPSCEHVVFSYLCDIGEFIYLAPRIEDMASKLIEKAEDDDLDYEAQIEAILEKLSSKSILCFSITTTGMACGPTSSAVYVAADFRPATE